MSGESRRDYGSAEPDAWLPMVDHLEELRLRLFIAAGFWLAATVGAWFFAQPVLDWLMIPARRSGAEFIFLGPQEALFTLVKLSILMGLMVSAPVWLYEAAAFAWPGLTRPERRTVLFSLPIILILFVLGITFAYFVLLQYVFRFFIGFAGPDITATFSIGSYVSFVISLTLPFGFVFQLPVLMAVLAYVGIITPAFLKANRRLALLAILVIAAVLTPPDVISQLAMAVPLYLLYEIGIWVAVLAQRRKREVERNV